MAKNFRELEREALAEPKRRANVERERTLLLGAIRLRELRTARGLSQTELAKRLGVTQKRVSAIERAEDLNISTLERYVDALGGRLQADAEFDDETVALTPRRAKRRRRRKRAPA
jgi:transcriptional regulator with XRE-family HTH domain